MAPLQKGHVSSLSAHPIHSLKCLHGNSTHARGRLRHTTQVASAALTPSADGEEAAAGDADDEDTAAGAAVDCDECDATRG